MPMALLASMSNQSSITPTTTTKTTQITIAGSTTPLADYSSHVKTSRLLMTHRATGHTQICAMSITQTTPGVALAPS